MPSRLLQRVMPLPPLHPLYPFFSHLGLPLSSRRLRGRGKLLVGRLSHWERLVGAWCRNGRLSVHCAPVVVVGHEALHQRRRARERAGQGMHQRQHHEVVEPHLRTQGTEAVLRNGAMVGQSTRPAVKSPRFRAPQARQGTQQGSAKQHTGPKAT